MESVKLTKKVCFIMTDAISYEMLCRGQLEYFKENLNFDMTFISGGDPKNVEKLVERKIGNIVDAKFVRKPSLLKDIKSLITLTSYFSVNRFDLVVYSTPKALLLGSLSTSLTRHKNTIAIIRGRAYENYNGRKRTLYQLLDKISLFNSKKVIFISKSLMDAYLKEGLVNQKKSFLLGSGSSNGVNTDKFKPNSLLRKDIDTLSYKEQFTVLIAGRICPDKGLYDLAKIVSLIKNPNIIFRLVGPIEDSESEEFLNFLKLKYSSIEHILYTNSIENYFQEADLHLFLTHREGFGNVAIEAASCNVPTFAYDVVGVKDSVNEGVSGKKFAFQDFESIANAIDEASKDPSFKSKYPNARDWAIESFEQQKVWNNYLSFYNFVLKQSS